MNWKIVILIIVLGILIGYFGYKSLPFKFTPNVPILLQISFDELDALDEKLLKANESEKKEIENRKEEIYNLLKQFFGKNIRNELV